MDVVYMEQCKVACTTQLKAMFAQPLLISYDARTNSSTTVQCRVLLLPYSY
jgi:hypothetical protein